MKQRPQQSRWKATEISFGPVGRIACTLVVLLPVWWLYSADVVQLALTYQIGCFFAAATWTAFVVPFALRDTWKKVPDHEAPAIIDLPPERGPVPPEESILERPAPQRW